MDLFYKQQWVKCFLCPLSQLKKIVTSPHYHFKKQVHLDLKMSFLKKYPNPKKQEIQNDHTKILNLATGKL